MEKIITYTPHLELRLKLREIPHDLPRKIYSQAREKYLDMETHKCIAVKSVAYRGKMREFAVIYEENNDRIFSVSIHPLKIYQKLNRVKSGRWKKL